MDDDTIDEQLFVDDLQTVPDNKALDPDLDVGDSTVVTSAAPEPAERLSPWPDRDHLIRGGVYFASGSTRVA